MVKQAFETLDFNKLIIPLTLDILENSINVYFKTKQIRNLILNKLYHINLRGPKNNVLVFDRYRLSISHQLGLIFHTLKELGYIKKDCIKTWKKERKIDLSPTKFIENFNHKKKAKL